tara:strand:+ start:67 stop:210 length:144 start_codon:yes stop_codon:yes gene_type:complete
MCQVITITVQIEAIILAIEKLYISLSHSSREKNTKDNEKKHIKKPKL